MEHYQAIDDILEIYGPREYERGKSDCATLVADYIEMRTGTRPEWNDTGKPPTKRYIQTILGEPEPNPAESDVVLTKDGGLALHLGYALLAMVEGMGLARMEIGDNIKAAWSVK